MDVPMDVTAETQAVVKRVVAETHKYLHGEQVQPLYLADDRHDAASLVFRTVMTLLRSERQADHVLQCSGSDFARLWHDTLRRGMTPFIRRALNARRVILVDEVERLQDEPFAQFELARLVTSDRLIILAGHSHLRQIACWNPALAARLKGAACLTLHSEPPCSDADALKIVDLVAGYYALPRVDVLSRRRTAPVVLARQSAMYLLRERGLTYYQIGRILQRDHATVLYGYTRIQEISACRRNVRAALSALLERAWGGEA